MLCNLFTKLITNYPIIAGAIIAALGAILVSFFNALAQFFVNWRRIVADNKLAKTRFDFEKQLAERKINLDLEVQDRKRKQEFAEELIAGFLEFRDIIGSIRSPFGYEGEGLTRQKQDNETPTATKRLNQQFVVRERYKGHHEAVSRLLSKKYRATTWFGSSIEESFVIADKILKKIFLANDFMEGTKRLDVIYEGFSDRDEIIEELSDAIRKIEEICRPVLEHRIKSS